MGFSAGAFLAGAALAALAGGCAGRETRLTAEAPLALEGAHADSGRLLEEKCSRCHDLARVYAVVGAGGEWVRTVVVMSGKDRAWISAREMEDIASCALEAAGPPGHPASTAPPPEAERDPRAVVREKCSHCHELGRIYAAIDDPARWVRTVMAMSAKDRGWMPPAALRDAVRYRRLHGAYVQRLFDGSCGTCHDWEKLRARAKEKTVSQWRTEVNYMARRCSPDLAEDEREAIYRALAATR